MHEDSWHRRPGTQTPPAFLSCPRSPTFNIEVTLKPGRCKGRCKALKIPQPTCHGKQLPRPHLAS